MMSLLPALGFGFVLGLRHATDADHVAAIGTLLSSGRSPRQAAIVGAMWGVGHSLSVLLVGGALIALRTPMPARLALGFEFVVAIMLIALGIRSLRARRAAVTPPGIRPLLVGVVHGLAGTAVLALLVLGTARTGAAAAAYLLLFGVGTIAGMAVITALLALPSRFGQARAIAFDRGIRVVAGAASVVIGVLLAHRVGIEDGLFAATVLPGP
jgi:hypothetical protein